MCLRFVYALAEFALIEMLELFDVFFGELHMSRGVQSVFHASDCVKVRTCVELQTVIPIGLDVLVDCLAASEDELSFVWISVSIHCG